MGKYEKTSAVPAKGSGSRILALDAARGLAVAGMYVQHFALTQWNSFVSGNTMILFMLCSGISYTIMLQHMQGKPASAVRTQVLARAVFLYFTGYTILLLNGPFGMVLPAYAMIVLLAFGLRDVPPARLAKLCGLFFVVCPVLMIIGQSLFFAVDLLGDLFGGPLSALAWLPVFATGMWIGHQDLRQPGTQRTLIAVGLILLVPTKIFTEFALPSIHTAFTGWLNARESYVAGFSNVDEWAAWPGNVQPPMWYMLTVDMPQGGSMFELLIGTGGSMVLLGVLCRTERLLPQVLRFLSAAGKSSLTLYAVQFVIAWVASLCGGDVTNIPICSVPGVDLLVAMASLLLGVVLHRFPAFGLEAAMRKFEKSFASSQ